MRLTVLLLIPLARGLQAMQTASRARSEYQPSKEFLSAGKQDSTLPYGQASPPDNWNPVVFENSFPNMDYPKDMEYSLDYGDTILSYSWHRQDVKILTQLLINVTNGFFLETNCRDGEHGSNTLLFELTGWRGLLMEPRLFWYVNLWSKFRKAWLFMGTISPNDQWVKVGFDSNGKVDQLSGHQVHSHPLKSFLAEMGGRKVIDFWSLNNGGFEPEALNATLFGSSANIEIGVICVTINYRISGRGYEPWAVERSKDDSEQMIYDIMHRAGFRAVGGLNPQWINKVVPRWVFQDAVFVNPKYYEKRKLPVPAKLYSAPPPPMNDASYTRLSHLSLTSEQDLPLADWNEGLTHKQETAAMVDYIKKARAAAKSTEVAGKAHRVAEETWVPRAQIPYVDPRHL